MNIVKLNELVQKWRNSADHSFTEARYQTLLECAEELEKEVEEAEVKLPVMPEKLVQK